VPGVGVRHEGRGHGADVRAPEALHAEGAHSQHGEDQTLTWNQCNATKCPSMENVDKIVIESIIITVFQRHLIIRKVKLIKRWLLADVVTLYVRNVTCIKFAYPLHFLK
jgi:hypothetical protein